jgi:hypothetical protein
MAQMRMPTEEPVSRETGYGTAQVHPDGTISTPTCAVYAPELRLREPRLVDGHPIGIYSTLVDYEDDAGRVPAER